MEPPITCERERVPVANENEICALSKNWTTQTQDSIDADYVLAPGYVFLASLSILVAAFTLDK
jgi:hypothetical protein